MKATNEIRAQRSPSRDRVKSKLLVALSVMLATAGALAETRYVNVNSTNPVAPFLTWETAATNIQDAVDGANSGDEVVVTNGVYNFGSRVVIGSIRRVAVTRQLLLRSVNGPGATTIDGSGSVGCVFLTNGATLIGFTLTNGLGDGGGVYCNSANFYPNSPDTIVSNCVIVGNSAPGAVYISDAGSFSEIMLVAGYGGGACGGTLKDCIIAGNTGCVGGGAYESVLDHCAISNNVVTSTNDPPWWPVHAVGGSGGGVANSSLSNCSLTGNYVDSYFDSYGGGADQSSLTDCILAENAAVAGGGAAGSALTNCVVSGNSALYGGGVAESHSTAGKAFSYSGDIPNDAIPSYLYRCLVKSNSAESAGGGSAFSAVLSSCLLAGNTAGTNGGGSFQDAALENCTIVANTARTGGGVFSGQYSAVDNCILMFNIATNGADWSGELPEVNCTCVSLLPTNGVGNFTNAPLFADAANGDFHLLANSPCINAGNNVYVTSSTDLDGNPRISGGTVDVGAYEFAFTPPMLVRLAMERDNGDGFFIRFTGTPNSTFRLQRAPALTGPWSDIATNTAPRSGLIEYHETSAPPGNGFYRVLQQ
jgi:hypothetical protein